MSIHAAVSGKFGQAVKYPGFLKKASVVKTSRTIGRLLNSYLDETEKPRRTIAPDGHEGIADGDYAALVMDRKAPLREGVDYLSAFPGVRFFGFTNDVLTSAHNHPASFTQNEQVRLIESWWNKETEDYAKKGYHLIFSLDPRMILGLMDRNIPADGVVLSAALKSIMVFASRYYPGDVLGGAIGVHFDRFHPHAHALLFPFTRNGHGLNLSPMANVNVGGRRGRVDFQGTMQRAFFDEGVELQKQLASAPPSIQPEEIYRQWVLVAEVASTLPERNLKPQPLVEMANKVLSNPGWVDAARPLVEAKRASFPRAVSVKSDVLETCGKQARILLADVKKGEDRSSGIEAQMREIMGSRRSDKHRAGRPIYGPCVVGRTSSGTISLLLGHDFDEDIPSDLLAQNRSVANLAAGPLAERVGARIRERAETVAASGARIHALRVAIGRAREEDVMLHEVSRFTTRIASNIGGALIGRFPRHLEPSPTSKSLLPSAEEAETRTSEIIARVSQAEAFSHRPFSAVADLNVPQSPYRRAGVLVDDSGRVEPETTGESRSFDVSSSVAGNFLASVTIDGHARTSEVLQQVHEEMVRKIESRVHSPFEVSLHAR